MKKNNKNNNTKKTVKKITVTIHLLSLKKCFPNSLIRV